MSHRYLIDKSALARSARPAVRETLNPLHERGLLCVTGAVEVEILYSARNANEADRLGRWLTGFDYLPCPDEVWDAALDIQRQAIAKGNHRAFSMADLLIAATAQRHGATVLHYDGDYDQIAAITGYPSRWVAEPGTAD
ncbi:PIN family toxin-antitoxin system, toxin component [Streptomyces himastatinicus ATCC 53653]|uniref:Ribonuclease VapC n=1 Tax=Streptomyces himastatinicus ATCC 53653 TaxID=457427 RepID=D9WET0_9ACTN|nr:PIN domain nuclease [Streptomyces himastatinicus]EFL25295.1 PIN family toxin-antitoxin system, toxin component [Streptomyces himastatinicus ATCC 53653]